MSSNCYPVFSQPRTNITLLLFFAFIFRIVTVNANQLSLATDNQSNRILHFSLDKSDQHLALVKSESDKKKYDSFELYEEKDTEEDKDEHHSQAALFVFYILKEFSFNPDFNNNFSLSKPEAELGLSSKKYLAFSVLRI